MGLVVFHCKATKVKPAELHPFSENYITFEMYPDLGFDTEFDYFSDHIQLIEVPKTINTLIFIKEKSKQNNNIDYFVDDFLKYGYKIIYNKFNDMDNYIIEFQTKHNILDLTVHKWDTPSWCGVHLLAWELKTGFYYNEIGDQRNGMSQLFYKRFCKNIDICNFTEKPDFEFAFSCIDLARIGDTEDLVQERKKLFQKNFIDAYEQNRSWMGVSY